MTAATDPILLGVSLVVGLYCFFIVPLWVLLDCPQADPRRYYWVSLSLIPLVGVAAYGVNRRRGTAFLHVLITFVMAGGLIVMALQGAPRNPSSADGDWKSIPKSPITPFNVAEMRESSAEESSMRDVIREEDGRWIILDEEITLSGFRLGDSTSDIIYRPEKKSRSYRSFSVPTDDDLLFNWEISQYRVAFFMKYRGTGGEETVAALYMPGDRLTPGSTKEARHGGYGAEFTLVSAETEMVPKAAFAPDDLIPEFKRLTFQVLLYHTASGRANPAR